MLDLNITLLFQLANFFIALFVLNILLIRPIREIIKKRNGIMDGMSDEAGSFENQAAAEGPRHPGGDARGPSGPGGRGPCRPAQADKRPRGHCG
jgi:hypothetical protein